MKMLVVSILVLSWTVKGYSQDTLKTSYEPWYKSSYNIGKSPDPEMYTADSIPLFIVKGGGKSYKISPVKILELKPKGNNLFYVIPEFIESAFLYGKKSMPNKYKKYDVTQVMELYLLKDKAYDAFRLLKDRGYIK